MDGGRKYKFSWDLLGDIDLGRPNLGRTTQVEIYRLMQFTFRDVIEKEYGTQAADEIFFKAGKLAGDHFYRHFFADISDYNEFIRHLQQVLKDNLFLSGLVCQAESFRRVLYFGGLFEGGFVSKTGSFS